MIFIKNIAKTVLIVTIFSCIERASGFLYRVFLSRYIGAEGLGLYQIALSVIGVLITLSSSGIPITVSRLMIKEKAHNNENAQNNAVTAGILTSILISLPICVLCFVFKDKLGFIFADKRCVVLFLIILPGVVLTSIYAVIRGFFWGTKSFYVYSVIELLEELVMIICGIVFVLRADTVMQKAVWASFAVLISYIFSFTLSSAVFVAKGGRLKNPCPQLKPLLKSSAPITFMRASNSMTSSLVALILPAALIVAGADRQTAIAQFGVISGMTIPLLFIPSTIIGSLALVLSPELCENYYKKNVGKVNSNIEKSLLYCIFLCLLLIPLFAGSGVYIGNLVYNNELSGIYLRDSAFIMIPMSITLISTSLLNSIGFERKTLAYFLIGAVLMLLSIIILPQFIGNYALIAGYFLSFSTSGFLNLKLLKKICGGKLLFTKKLFICIPVCLAACFFDYFVFQILQIFIFQFLAMILAFLLTFAFVVILLFVFNILKPEEFKSLQKNKIFKNIKKTNGRTRITLSPKKLNKRKNKAF